jgi:CBS domain-containing protein
MKVAQACSSKGPACPRETTVADAAALLLEHEVDSLPVLDRRDRVIGMASDRDLASAVGHHASAAKLPVESFMDRNIATCHPVDDVRQVLPLMALLEATRIPVVDELDRLWGVLSIADVLAAALLPGGIPGLPAAEVIASFYRITRRPPADLWATVRARIRVAPRAAGARQALGRSA